MRLLLTYFVPAVLAALFLAASEVPAQSVGERDALTRGLTIAGDSQARLTARREAMQKRMDGLSAEVARLKKSVAGGGFSPVEQYRLGERLRQSQALADSLDSLNLSLDQASRETARIRRSLYQDYTAEVDSLSRELRGSRGKSALLARIEALDRERARLLAGASGQVNTDYAPGNLTLLRVDPGDSPEEVLDKLDFTGDLAARVERSLGRTEADIRRIRDESAVRRRIGEFTQDLGLFDEGLASRRTGGRSPSSAANAGDDSHQPAGFSDRYAQETEPMGRQDLTSSSGTTLDRDLFDPEKEHSLLDGLGYLTPRELEQVLARLQARRDSLQADLDRFRQLEKSLRRQADGLGIEKEGAGAR